MVSRDGRSVAGEHALNSASDAGMAVRHNLDTYHVGHLGVGDGKNGERVLEAHPVPPGEDNVLDLVSDRNRHGGGELLAHVDPEDDIAEDMQGSGDAGRVLAREGETGAVPRSEVAVHTGHELGRERAQRGRRALHGRHSCRG